MSKRYPAQRAAVGGPMASSDAASITNDTDFGLAELDRAIAQEEAEKDRAFGLGFSGPEFEAYLSGIDERIGELRRARALTAQLLLNSPKIAPNVTIQDVKAGQRDQLLLSSGTLSGAPDHQGEDR